MSLEKRKYERPDYLKMLEHNINNAIEVTRMFDKGKFECVTLLIGVIRSIVHDTSHSISLLQRLKDKKSIYFLDTSIDTPHDTFHLQNFLFGAYVRKPNETHHMQTILPKFFFEDNRANAVHFNEWWNKTVIIIDENKFSRKDIILISAHKHGILHADEEVDSVYYYLANNILSFAYYTETLDIEDPNVKIDPIDNSLFSLIRQITHELLLTLINYYDLETDYGVLSEEEKLNIAQPIYDLSVAINPEFHEAHRDIIRTREEDN